MKTLKLIAVGIVLFLTNSIHAQVSVNVNIGTPPSWGPRGYVGIEYYYLPDIQTYYDIRTSQFIYFGNGRWIRSGYLPRQYRNYDLYSGYKVVLNDYHGRTPYIYYKNHQKKYYKGYKGPRQITIGERHDGRDNYNRNKNNSHRGNNGHGNDHGNRKH